MLLDVGYYIRYDLYEIVLKLDTDPKIFFLDDIAQKKSSFKITLKRLSWGVMHYYSL